MKQSKIYQNKVHCMVHLSYFLTNFLHLEQSVKSHDFQKCGNSFLEGLSEDKDENSVRNW